jgi:hypothetical protein
MCLSEDTQLSQVLDSDHILFYLTQTVKPVIKYSTTTGSLTETLRNTHVKIIFSSYFDPEISSYKK